MGMQQDKFIRKKIIEYKMEEKEEEKIEQPIEEKKYTGPFSSKEKHIEAVNRRLEEKSNIDICAFIRYMKG